MVLAVCVWAAGHLDANRRSQTTLCSSLPLWISWWGPLMSRNWGTGKLCDLSDVTEEAYGKVRISIHLPWSQADFVSPNISFAFQCIWCFPCVIPHHGTNAVQIQSPNSYLWLAGNFSHLVWEGLKESSYHLFITSVYLLLHLFSQGRNEMFGGTGLYS